MAKILNLDKLISEVVPRQLVIDGVSFPIDEMTVENFIATSLAAERVVKEESLGKQVEATVDMICRSVPTAPRDRLVKYPLSILAQITAFVRGDDVDEQEEVSTEEGAGAGEETGK